MIWEGFLAEVAATSLKALSRHLHGEADDNHEKYASVPTENGTEHVPNTSPDIIQLGKKVKLFLKQAVEVHRVVRRRGFHIF
jgi:hypothetical protein